MTTRTALFVISLGMLPVLGASALADNFQVDPVHSGVFFRIKHLGVGYSYGRFNDLSGQVVLDEKTPTSSTFQLQVKADSIDTANAKRDGHLKGPDFFNTKEFPTISFQSKQVKLLDPKTYEVSGDLNLHGVTKAVTIKLTRVGSDFDKGKNFRTGFEGNLTIRRSDFGMNYSPQDVGDEVWMLIGFEAIKK